MPTPCPICAAPRRVCFRTRLLDRYDIDYWHCPGCGLVQTETPFWLDEAYGSAITSTDIGLVARNIENSRRVACLLYFCFDRRGRYLDLGGGYGLFTRMMRDIGFDYYWSDQYCQNLFAEGLEAEQAAKPLAALSAFEVMEHVPDPLDFARTHLERYGARTLIFSQRLYQATSQGDPPPPEAWDYYSPGHGQHISFFEARTLDALAGQMGLRRYSYRTTHVLTDRPLNARLLPLLLGRPAVGLVEYVKKRMTSRHLEDLHRVAGVPSPQ